MFKCPNSGSNSCCKYTSLLKAINSKLLNNIMGASELRINVKFLMMAKEAAGISEAFFELTEHSSLRDLIEKIIERSPRISSSAEEFISKYIVIINGISPRSIDESLSDGDLVEVMPLVSGG